MSATRLDRKPRALVVSSGADTPRRWLLWLAHGGFTTSLCGAFDPENWCPRVVGDPCPLREAADVAVVDLTTSDGRLAPDPYLEMCTTVPDDGRTILIRDGSIDVSPSGHIGLVEEPSQGVVLAVAEAVSGHGVRRKLVVSRLAGRARQALHP